MQTTRLRNVTEVLKFLFLLFPGLHIEHALDWDYRETVQKTVWYCPNNCGRKYSVKRNLKRHLRYECGVPKQFHCSICSKAFMRREHMMSHRILVHKIV